MENNAVALWSIASSIVSVLLGFMAVALSVYFFVVGRRTERDVSASLSKIETQADMLQRLAGKQLDRLTRFVTEERPKSEDPQLQRLIEVFIHLANPLSGSIAQAQQQPHARTTEELISCYIGLYYYSAVTNYWAQHFLPPAAQFNENDDLHTLSKRVVDQSATDFDAMAGVLTRTDQALVASNPLAHILEEAKELWRNSVRGSADVFVARERAD